jgi:hypothetical protein
MKNIRMNKTGMDEIKGYLEKGRRREEKKGEKTAGKRTAKFLIT